MTDFVAEATAMLPEAVALRRRIHEQPELGLNNPITAALVEHELQGLGVAIARGKSTSGLVVSLAGRRPGKTILLRADTDALPMPEDTGLPFKSKIDGRMHACGHDAHTAMLVHAARLLHGHRHELAGTVKFMFQPGEEGHHGARYMIEEGLIDADPKPDAAFALHIIPNIRASTFAGKAGPIMGSADAWQMIVRGRGGHASAPQNAIDPMPVAFEIGLALQNMVTRRHSVFDPVVVTVAHISGGTTDNVIPEAIELEGTLRATSPGARQAAKENIERIMTHVAAAHLCTAEIKFTQGYPVTVNDARFFDFAQEVAREVAGDQGFTPMASPLMGAEDFSYVLQRIPGVMFALGVMPDQRDPSGQVAPLHSNRMILNESAMVTGIAMHAAIATKFLAA